MTAVDVFPDIVLAARTWLVGRDAVQDLLDQRVSTKSPPDPIYPYATLQRIGGVPAERHRLDRCRLQVSCWAEGEGEAFRVASTLRAELHAMEGRTVEGAVVTGVDDDLGLAWAPDTVRTPPTPRYVFGVAIFAHAA